MAAPGDITGAAAEREQTESALNDAYSRQNQTWGRQSIAQTDFTGGVIDEMARGRLEHDIYKKSLDIGENVLVRTQGPVTRRSGYEWAHWGVRYADRATKSGWMESLQVSESERVGLVFGDATDRLGYLRAVHYLNGKPQTLIYKDDANDHSSDHLTSFNFTIGNPTKVNLVGASSATLSQFMFDDSDVYFSELEGTAPLTDLNDRWWTIDREYETPQSLDFIRYTIRTNMEFTVTAGHGYTDGDWVAFDFDTPVLKPNTSDWLCGHHQISVIDAQIFTINVDGREFFYVSGTVPANNIKVKKVDPLTFTIRGHNSTGGSHTAATGWFDVPFEREIPYTVAEISAMHQSLDNNKLVFTSRQTRSFYVEYASQDDASSNFITPLSFRRKEYDIRSTGTVLDHPYRPMIHPPQNIGDGGTGTTAGTLYDYAYRITAVDSFGNEGFAAEFIVEQRDLPATGAPSNFTLTWDADQFIADQVNAGANAGSWKVYSYNVVTGKFQYRATVAGTLNTWTETVNPASWFPASPLTGSETDLSISPNVGYPFKDLGRDDETLGVEKTNYFATVSIAEDRMILASTAGEPSLVFTSAAGSFENFTGTQPLYAYGDTVTDASAIKVRAAAQDQRPIESIAVLNDILLMTETAEVRFGPGNQDPITPSNNGLKAQSYNGTNLLQVIQMEDAALYVSNKGPTIRDIRYNTEGLAGSSYGGRELTVLSGELLEGRTIVQWASVGKPESAVVMVLDNGQALWMTYHQEHGVVAFTQFNTPNQWTNYLGVISLSEGTDNGIYFMMERPVKNPNAISEPTECTIERMYTNRVTDLLEDAVYLDSCNTWRGESSDAYQLIIITGAVTMATYGGRPHGLTAGDWVRIETFGGVGMLEEGIEWANSEWEVYDTPAAATWRPKDQATGLPLTIGSVSALYNFPGNPVAGDFSQFQIVTDSVKDLFGLAEFFTSSVSGILDGNWHNDLTVNATTKKMTLPYRVRSYCIGRPYASEVGTLPILPPLGENDVFSSEDQVGLVSARLIKTLGIEFSLNDGDQWQGMKDRTSEPFFQHTRAITGDVHQLVLGEWRQGAKVRIRQMNNPYPMTISAIIPELWHGEL